MFKKEGQFWIETSCLLCHKHAADCLNAKSASEDQHARLTSEVGFGAREPLSPLSTATCLLDNKSPMGVDGNAGLERDAWPAMLVGRGLSMRSRTRCSRLRVVGRSQYQLAHDFELQLTCVQ